MLQSAVGQLHCVLHAAMSMRGEIDPRLAELVAGLLAYTAPGSADHLEWCLAARETAEVRLAHLPAVCLNAWLVCRFKVFAVCTSGRVAEQHEETAEVSMVERA